METGTTLHREIEWLVDEAVAAERERCAKLIDLRADITKVSATKIRARGTFNATQLTWHPPFFKSVSVVAHKWENAARDLEAVERAFRMMAGFIRAGTDPDTLL